MKTEGSKNVSCKPEIVFEKYPDNLPPLRIDEKPMSPAYLAIIESGEFKGSWIFTNKDRAEEFAWKRELPYRFEENELPTDGEEDYL